MLLEIRWDNGYEVLWKVKCDTRTRNLWLPCQGDVLAVLLAPCQSPLYRYHPSHPYHHIALTQVSFSLLLWVVFLCFYICCLHIHMCYALVLKFGWIYDSLFLMILTCVFSLLTLSMFSTFLIIFKVQHFIEMIISVSSLFNSFMMFITCCLMSSLDLLVLFIMYWVEYFTYTF